MKAMIYNGIHKPVILLDGVYRGREFKIVSFGMHPCAYVESQGDEEDKAEGTLGLNELAEVHGGFTYGGPLPEWANDNSGKHYLGWDYAHPDDYVELYPTHFLESSDIPEEFQHCDGKKWTTEEIFEEVKYVIDQLIDGKGQRASKKRIEVLNEYLDALEKIDNDPNAQDIIPDPVDFDYMKERIKYLIIEKEKE